MINFDVFVGLLVLNGYDGKVVVVVMSNYDCLMICFFVGGIGIGSGGYGGFGSSGYGGSGMFGSFLC